MLNFRLLFNFCVFPKKKKKNVFCDTIIIISFFFVIIHAHIWSRLLLLVLVLLILLILLLLLLKQTLQVFLYKEWSQTPNAKCQTPNAKTKEEYKRSKFYEMWSNKIFPFSTTTHPPPLWKKRRVIITPLGCVIPTCTLVQIGWLVETNSLMVW